MTQDIFSLNLLNILSITLLVGAVCLFCYAIGYQRGVDDTHNNFTNPFKKK